MVKLTRSLVVVLALENEAGKPDEDYSMGLRRPKSLCLAVLPILKIQKPHGSLVLQELKDEVKAVFISHSCINPCGISRAH